MPESKPQPQPQPGEVWRDATEFTWLIFPPEEFEFNDITAVRTAYPRSTAHFKRSLFPANWTYLCALADVPAMIERERAMREALQAVRLMLTGIADRRTINQRCIVCNTRGPHKGDCAFYATDDQVSAALELGETKKEPT